MGHCHETLLFTDCHETDFYVGCDVTGSLPWCDVETFLHRSLPPPSYFKSHLGPCSLPCCFISYNFPLINDVQIFTAIFFL